MVCQERWQRHGDGVVQWLVKGDGDIVESIMQWLVEIMEIALCDGSLGDLETL